MLWVFFLCDFGPQDRRIVSVTIYIKWKMNIWMFSMGYFSITCNIALTNDCKSRRSGCRCLKHHNSISSIVRLYIVSLSMEAVFLNRGRHLNVSFLKVGPSPSHISQPFVARILDLPLPGRWECARGQVPVWMTSLSSTWPKPPSLHWDSYRSPACSHVTVIISCRSTQLVIFKATQWFLYLKSTMDLPKMRKLESFQKKLN